MGKKRKTSVKKKAHRKTKKKFDPTQRKLNCPGVNWHPSSGKWLAMHRYKGKGWFCCYAESEKEAIKLRDQKLLEKIVGPTTETFFPKKNYDVKKAAKTFRAYKTEVGITNAERMSLVLTTKLGKNNLFRHKTIEKRTIKGKTSHYVYVNINNIKTCVGHCPKEKECDKLWATFREKQAPKYVEDYRDLRSETINKFRETPCSATYKLM